MPPSPPLRLALIAALFAAPVATAGLFSKRDKVEAEPVEAAPRAPAAPRDAGPLWDEPLPMPTSPLPAGLANRSAQGCAACHAPAVETWARSAHSQGPSPALRLAAQEHNAPACLSCHLPLQAQHRDLITYDGGDPKAPVAHANPTWDASLAVEGVTCAACHLRKGEVVGPRSATRAPHPARIASQVQTSTMCATCHQLTWPGADKPLYDTFGEWQRSAWAKAGVSCQACHMRPGVASGPPRHDVDLPPAQAVSALLATPTGPVERGGIAQPITLTLQNTGAGHAFPTGSPFQGVRAEVVVNGPDGKDGRTDHATPIAVDLARTLEDAPPWRTTADTRLQAGEQRQWTGELALPVDAPPGAYTLEVRLFETTANGVSGPPFLVRSLPLPVQ